MRKPLQLAALLLCALAQGVSAQEQAPDSTRDALRRQLMRPQRIAEEPPPPPVQTLRAEPVPAAMPPVPPPALGNAAPGATPYDVNAPSWHDRYLLGAEDILNLSLYGHPELDRNDVFVQPDGTISFLEAQNVKAAGLTIDELRAEIETKLSEFYKQPRMMISAVELRSKRYFLMGKVVDKGAFPMDRPTTILEAVARARGIETGLFQQNTVELADMDRSFLVRGGRHMKVDFHKLFMEGDMSQNIQLEPGDYLYFPSANTDEVFVLGEVNSPSSQGYTPDLTVLAAITQRDGFTSAAYRERVLVVRGSLASPRLFVVDTNAVLKGRKPDFRLEPKDIVYVSSRPWKYAEDLGDVAVSAFVQTAVTTWTGESFGPFIKHAVLPKVRVE